MKNLGRAFACLLLSLTVQGLAAQTNSYLDSTRPTVSSDAAIQQRGVFQIESGSDGFYFPYDLTAATSLSYAATDWLRLDASLSIWRATDIGVAHRASAIGNSAFGAKAVLYHDGRSRIFPGIAIQYGETLATATQDTFQSRYHQGTLIISNSANRWRWKVNGSAIGSGCETKNGCSIHGQGAVGVSYFVNRSTTFATEFFGQTASVSAPPGAYAFAGVALKLSDHMAVNGGLRLGVSPSAPAVGFTVGVTAAVGRPRLRH